jgi:hypothetical protein
MPNNSSLRGTPAWLPACTTQPTQAHASMQMHAQAESLPHTRKSRCHRWHRGMLQGWGLVQPALPPSAMLLMAEMAGWAALRAGRIHQLPPGPNCGQTGWQDAAQFAVLGNECCWYKGTGLSSNTRSGTHPRRAGQAEILGWVALGPRRCNQHLGHPTTQHSSSLEQGCTAYAQSRSTIYCLPRAAHGLGARMALHGAGLRKCATA